MVEIETVRTLALALPDAVERDHRGRPSFCVGRTIFATLWPAEQRLVVRLGPLDQGMAMARLPAGCTPVPGAWGDRGWTNVALDCVDEDDVRDLLDIGWRGISPKRKRA